MSHIVKIVRDITLQKDDIYIDGVLTLSSNWFPDFTSPYVSVNSDFEFYSMSGLVELNYKGSVETDIRLFQFDLSELFDKVLIPDTLSFETWNFDYSNSLFFVIKNQFGDYSSLNEVNMTFNQDTAVATGLSYNSSSVSSSCDLSSVLLKLDEMSFSFDNRLFNLDEIVRYSILPIVTELTNNLAVLYTYAMGLSTKTDVQNISIDTTNLVTKEDLATINIDTTNLATKDDISVLAHYDISNITLPSLNGNGSEYKDGAEVTVLGRDVVYSVVRSYHSLYSDNGYTVHYDLVSIDGYKLTVPEALLTKYTTVV